MDRFSRVNNQAPAQTQLKKDSSPVGRSAHDFSYIHSGNALFGAVIPVDCFDVVPNEDISLSLAALLEFRNPSTRQLLNSCRVYFHAYYNRLTDLWEGAKNWIDKGRSGKLDLSRPNLIFKTVTTYSSTSLKANANTPLSLLNYLGLAPSVMHKTANPLMSFKTAYEIYDDTNSNKYSDYVEIGYDTDYFPADCCFAYQRNWRDFYSNKNLLQNNKFWFPDNEDHFIISYSATDVCAINYEDEDFASKGSSKQEYQYNNLCGHIKHLTNSEILQFLNRTLEPNNPLSYSQNFTEAQAPNLCGLKFRQFRGDRFTTSLPFPDLIRGDIPIININSQTLASVKGFEPDSQTPASNIALFADSSDNYNYGGFSSVEGQMYVYDADSEKSYYLKVPVSTTSSITMSDIYTLETLTAFKRRMAMTNGDYNDMIMSQFGYNPRVHERHGTYIGGYYQDFAFSSVVQTSESSTTPLGTKAGQGISSGSGNIGTFHTPDYGWIQIYMMVVPDVMYTKGKPRMFSKKSNLEMYFPLFNNLPAQHIRNDELYISGNPTTDSSPFAYEDRYAEYKSRSNRVSGFMGLDSSYAAFDSAKIMARRFDALPTLNSSFVTMIPEHIDMEVFTVADEPPIDFSVGISCRRVFPGPYTAIEGSLSSPDLMR